MELKGNLLGKSIYTYDPQIECDEDDLCRHLSQFRRIDFLRALADIDSQLFSNIKNYIGMLQGIPILNDLVSELTVRAVRCCTEDGIEQIPEEDILLAIRMCMRLLDKEVVEDAEGGLEGYMKISYKQFADQERILNCIARTLHIYLQLWDSVPEANCIAVQSEIEKVVGIAYDKLLIFVFMACGNQHSYIWPEPEDVLKKVSEHSGVELAPQDHQLFLDWCSADFETMTSPPNGINPVTRWPFLRTPYRPVEGKGDVYLKVSKRGLVNKATSGIYFALIDIFNQGGSANPFKRAYGYVFQEYIGELLRYHFRSWRVDRECKYGKQKIDSVDWLVHKKKKLILIEVKQSSIFLGTKMSGSLRQMGEDFNKTLGKAVRQLKKTRDDILTKKFNELAKYSHIEEFELLIVTGDPLYNANFIGRQTIDKDFDTEGLNYNIINVSDLEMLLAYQQPTECLFDDLQHKNADLRRRNQDFKEFILARFPWCDRSCTFLDDIYTGFFSKLNLPSAERPRKTQRKKRKRHKNIKKR